MKIRRDLRMLFYQFLLHWNYQLFYMAAFSEYLSLEKLDKEKATQLYNKILK